MRLKKQVRKERKHCEREELIQQQQQTVDTHGCVKGIWTNRTFPFGSTRIGGMVEGIVYKCSGEGIQEKSCREGEDGGGVGKDHDK